MTFDYSEHWDEKFRSRTWGRYPPEDLIRFVARRYFAGDRGQTRLLEIGCGPGANLWFMHREGLQVAGIDGSQTAVNQARQRLETENAGLNATRPDIRCGNFKALPWDNDSFDGVIDIYALYANPVDVIRDTCAEIFRVLKPGGRFYTKFWGRETAGYGSGRALDEGTFDQIESGPCKDMGVAHFFDEEEIQSIFHRFNPVAIEKIHRQMVTPNADSAVSGIGQIIEEFHCEFLKPDQ